MVCDIIVGHNRHGNGVECACFLDSVTYTVFGELMFDLEEADSFQKSVLVDLRSLSAKEFSRLLNEFRIKREEEFEREKEIKNAMINSPKYKWKHPFEEQSKKKRKKK